MKKLLIFTISTGNGHNQAAASLEEEFRTHGYRVVKLDALKETSRTLDTVITNGYEVLATRFPRAYGELYRLTDRNRVNSKVTGLITYLIKDRVHKLITLHRPDLIIATHPFMVDVIGSLKQRGRVSTPFISIVTDYDTHQTYVNPQVDAYITGSHYTKQRLMEKGIPSEKIHHYGIPVRKEFFINRGFAGASRNRFTVLLMGGSMGLSSMEEVVRALISCRNPLRIIAVCGKNEDLRLRLEKKYGEVEANKELNILGFTREIPELMDASDIIITKPGGLTVSEAMIKNLPMVIPFMIPGQEEENVSFLVRNNAAVRVDSARHITDVVDTFITNPASLLAMKRNLRQLTSSHSVKNIVMLAERLLERQLVTQFSHQERQG